MTKKLILLRHAKSYWGENGRFQFKGDDHDRPLNERGRKTLTSTIVVAITTNVICLVPKIDAS